MADLKRSPEMHGHDLIPHLFVHVDESLVSEDTSIGDEHMDRPKSIDTSLDDGIAILSRTYRSNSLSTDYTYPSARSYHLH